MTEMNYGGQDLVEMEKWGWVEFLFLLHTSVLFSFIFQRMCIMILW